MAGIYLHIPYCRQACSYCNFHFSTSLSSVSSMVNAMCTEIELRRPELTDTVHTIYFGGGTPSLLSTSQLQQLLNKLTQYFNIDSQAELTLEVNPDDITADKLHHYKRIGINRLSIGIQSFFNDDLKYMNRAHSAQQSFRTLELLNQAGFHNVSADVIYGFPNLSLKKLQQNLDVLLQQGIPHISAYSLTVEPKTALYQRIRSHLSPPVSSSQAAEHFSFVKQYLENHGYEHYEISNYALPGHRSRHNTSYWLNQPFVGIGPGAAGYTGSVRYTNVPNNHRYISNLNQGLLASTSEDLSLTDKYNEYVMTAIRTSWGINCTYVHTHFGLNYYNHLVRQSKKSIHTGHVSLADDIMLLTPAGQLFADDITVQLFYS